MDNPIYCRRELDYLYREQVDFFYFKGCKVYLLSIYDDKELITSYDGYASQRIHNYWVSQSEKAFTVNPALFLTFSNPEIRQFFKDYLNQA